MRIRPPIVGFKRFNASIKTTKKILRVLIRLAEFIDFSKASTIGKCVKAMILKILKNNTNVFKIKDIILKQG